MKIERESLKAFEFDGLEIRDYTAAKPGSSSIAEIIVPAGARHKRAWSRRSDKYYYIIDGKLGFTVDNQEAYLSSGDLIAIRQGMRFSYENRAGVAAKVLLVHTPAFELSDDVFEESA